MIVNWEGGQNVPSNMAGPSASIGWGSVLGASAPPAPSFANIRVGYHWLVSTPTKGTLPQTNRSVTYSIVQTSTGLSYDFGTQTFTATPATPTATLPETTSIAAGFYCNYKSLPLLGNFTDGEYRVTISSSGNPSLNRVLYTEILLGTDGYDPPPLGIYVVPAQVPTYFDRIVKDVRQLMVDVGLFNEQTAITTKLIQPYPNAGPPQLLVEPGSFGNDPLQNQGGGRYLTGAGGNITLHVIDEAATDIAQQDQYAMLRVPTATDKRMGLLRLAHLVTMTLQQYTPLDAAGNHIAQGPLTPTTELTPESYQTDATWRGLAITYNVPFTQKMTDTN